METARFIVCERSSRWANPIRAALDRRGPKLYETRSLTQCGEMLQEFPASFLAWELRPENAERLLEHLCSVWASFPRCGSVIVASRGMALWQWPLREAGAQWFVDSPRRIAPVVCLARRHLEAVAPAATASFEATRMRPFSPT